MNPGSPPHHRPAGPSAGPDSHGPEGAERAPGPGPLSADLVSLFDAARDGMVVITPDGSLVYVNPAAARMLGLGSPEQAPGRDGAKMLGGFVLMTDDGRPLSEDQLPSRLAARGEHPPTSIVRFRSISGGEDTWAELTSAPLLDAAGGVRFIVTTVRDVTRQRHSARALRLLAEAGATVASSLDYHQTLKALARLMVPEVADLCAVEVYEEDGSILRELAADVPARENAALELWRRFHFNSRVLGKVMDSGQPELIKHVPVERLEAAAVDAEHLALLRAVSPRAYLCVPLKARGRALGTFTLLLSSEARRFDESDLTLAMELGNRAAQAVDNARLYREAKAALARKDQEAQVNDALQRLGTTFASELDAGRLIQLIVEEATLLFHAGSGAFHPRPDGAGRTRWARAFSSAPGSDAALAWSAALFAPEAGFSGVLHSDDVAGDARLAGHAPPSLADGPAVRSLLAAPVVSRSGEVLGTLSFGHPRPGAFTVDHERVVSSLAAQAAVALDNARLFSELHETQERLRVSEERQRLALSAGQVGFFDWDIRTGRAHISPRFEELLGYEPGCFDGSIEAFWRAVHPEDIEGARSHVHHLVREGISDDQFIFRSLHQDGSVRWMEIYSQVLNDAEGKRSRMSGVVVDVTFRRESEDNARRLMQELARSNRSWSNSPTWPRTICRSRCGWWPATRSFWRAATGASWTRTRTSSSASRWTASRGCSGSSTIC